MSDMEDIEEELEVREEMEKLKEPPGAEEKRCGDCIFWHGGEKVAEPVCKKNPPLPVAFTTDTAFGRQTGVRPEFPPMEENDWCHSFKSERMVATEQKYRMEALDLLGDFKELLTYIELNTAKKDD